MAESNTETIEQARSTDIDVSLFEAYPARPTDACERDDCDRTGWPVAMAGFSDGLVRVRWLCGDCCDDWWRRSS